MKLSDFELDVMQVFWDRGAHSAPQMHKIIEKDKPVAYSTVKTIIDRLEEKGAITRERNEGRTIYYRAAVSKDIVTNSLIPNFIKRLFKGNSRLLISHLIENEKLDEQDLDYLNKLIKQKKQQK